MANDYMLDGRIASRLCKAAGSKTTKQQHVIMRNFGSSGDVSIDRRFEYVRAALNDEDGDTAADLLHQIIEVAPKWPVAWFHLGLAERMRANRSAARDAFRKTLTLDLSDQLGARLHLALLGDGNADKAMSSAYITALFDDYAPRFDNHLIKNLEYRAPEIIAEALRAACAKSGRPYRFRHVIDVGCGTGLVGNALERRFDRLTGVDLSSGMLNRARKHAIYSRLVQADMVAFLRAEPAKSVDLVISADAFIYVGHLEAVLAAIFEVLEPNGILAFTVQKGSGDTYSLGEDLRFSFPPDYIRAELAKANFRNTAVVDIVERKDLGTPVPSLLVLTERSR
jgi:predicted TPR repeat methyltransferase